MKCLSHPKLYSSCQVNRTTRSSPNLFLLKHHHCWSAAIWRGMDFLDRFMSLKWKLHLQNNVTENIRLRTNHRYQNVSGHTNKFECTRHHDSLIQLTYTTVEFDFFNVFSTRWSSRIHVYHNDTVKIRRAIYGSSKVNKSKYNKNPRVLQKLDVLKAQALSFGR